MEGLSALLYQEVLVAPRDAVVPLPDTRIIERPGWRQIITPSLRQGGLNEVSFAALDEAEADAVIDATLAEYQSLGLRFRWSVPPGSRPADLAERLARRGLERSATCAMVRNTADAADPSAETAGNTVEVVDARTLDVFTEVMAAGWAVDPASLHTLNRLILDDPAARQRLYLARHAGVPAATAGLAVFAGSIYLLGAVVLPAFRGRGLYRALTQARLRDGAALGRPLATCHARATTSAPILERCGFTTVCRFPIFTSA